MENAATLENVINFKPPHVFKCHKFQSAANIRFCSYFCPACSFCFLTFTRTSRVPAEGTSSVCLICMKYRIIFLIIIIISLGQILLSYIANTSRTHTHPVHTHPPHTHRRRRIAIRWVCTQPSPYRYSMGLCQPTVTARGTGDNSWSLAIEINTGTGGPVSPRF